MTTKTTATKTAAPKVDFKPTMTVKQLDTAIKSVCEESKTIQQRIQDVAVGIMLHCYKHNDFSRAQTLVDGLGDGIRKKGLVGWFNKCGLNINQEAGTFNGFNKAIMERNWGEYRSKPWWECNPEKPFKVWDFDTELKRLIKAAEKKQAEEDKARAKWEADTSEDKGEYQAITTGLDAEKLIALKLMVVNK